LEPAVEEHLPGLSFFLPDLHRDGLFAVENGFQGEFRAVFLRKGFCLGAAMALTGGQKGHRLQKV
jgi:hypothetical protein